ncbi:TonB-dependent receptor plug domain-containing protein [Methylobacter sp.]|uniref:TonB-dependent receptor plug domain-containing protein n=1 Tax=Methylobacter sp. TaxID=2051955 RepID=UPI002FDDDE11
MRNIKNTLILTVISAGFGIATAQAAPDAEVADLSLEELMDVKIYSAAKKEQAMSDTAAAAFVISQEDIRRSGATSIPDALRMAPGVQVAQINAHDWAISIRGFNDRFSNKLLVLIDGRTVYSPLFSGTYWSAQDVVLEDIDRIEVIRGPGGTVWGANAVNGVINIRTKHSKNTQGGLVSAQGGNYQNGGSVRYGGELGKEGTYRVYAKGKQNSDYLNRQNQNAHDQWSAGQGGFRADYALTGKDELLFSGDIQEMEGDETIGLRTPVDSSMSQRNANATAKLTHKTENGEWYLQSFYLTDERRGYSLNQLIDTFDVEFQHNFQAGQRNAVTWGLDYRLVSDELTDFNGVSFTPASRATQLFSALLQDQFSITDDLRLTVGSKVEHNDYSGFEYQPNARLLWKLNENHSTWTSASRAVRTPTRGFQDIRIDLYRIPAIPPFLPNATAGAIVGDTGFKSEEVIAFEWGYRGQMSQNLSFDVATFYNTYNNLLSSYPKVVQSPGLTQNLSVMVNGLEAESYGAELYANWKVTDSWRLQPGYTWLTVDTRTKSSNIDTGLALKNEGSSPQNQYSIRSQLSLPHNIEFDTSVYYVDNLRDTSTFQNPMIKVPNYTRLDLRLGWRPIKALELSVAGQNLLDGRHPEFIADDIVASQIPRSVYGKAVVTW